MTQQASELRDELANEITSWYQLLGMTLPGRVEAAMRRVERHLFTPGIPIEQAYADDAVLKKTNSHGITVSSVSAPGIVAMMLDQLQVQPGHRILEIGSGGYNAALLRELAGPGGSVTTIDIDPDVAERARGCLAAAGYPDVRVLCGDGELGAPGYGPFDRIIVTAGAWDIAPAWSRQLTPDGRLVVPLRTRGLCRSWALIPDDGRLIARAPMMCGFVPMQGVGAHHGEQITVHGGDITLSGERPHPGQPDPGLAPDVMSAPRAEAWTGVTVTRMEPFDLLDLWLATALADFWVLSARQEAVDRGLVSPSWKLATPALASQGTIAYRTRPRPASGTGPDQATFEFGAYAHGPAAQEAAGRLAEQIQAWDCGYRRGPAPQLTVCPAGTPDDDLPSGLVLNKEHTRMIISWPATTRPSLPMAAAKEGL